MRGFGGFMLPGERAGGPLTSVVPRAPTLLARALRELPPFRARKGRHMKTGRIRGTALLVAAMALILAACGSSAPDGGSAAGSATRSAGAAGVERPDLKVAVVPALDSAGFFIALYGGLFTSAGLNVQFIPATSSETAIAGQEKGSYDITGGNYVSYIQAQAAGT